MKTPKLFLAFVCIIGAALVADIGYSVFPSPPADIAEINLNVGPDLNAQLAKKRLKIGQPVFMRIFKQSSKLQVWIKHDGFFRHFKSYPICNYSGDLGPKLKEGDRQSPEGFYKVSKGQMNPNSTYHLSFNLGYPNKFDRTLGRTGSYLMVHGNCLSIGCYAMTDAGIEEIYLLADAALNNGQSFFRVHIYPFEMSAENLGKFRNSEWIDYWQNLKTGYDLFEQQKIPPDVSVKNKLYVFNSLT